MQRTWEANLKWDDPLTSDLQQAWSAYAEDLGEVHTIQVPRSSHFGHRRGSFLFACIL